jgi:3-methyladenine DNA glycosylase Tag
MKKLLLSAICTAALSLNASASLKSANNFKFVGDTQYAELCQAAATNDLALFKRNVKQHGFRLGTSKNKMLSLLASEDNFQCAGQSLVDFSESRGSQSIADYISGSEAKVTAVSTNKFKFIGDENFKNFCKSAVTNNVDLFKRAVSKQIGNLGFSKKEVMDRVLDADNVTCSGQSLEDFFQSREATNVMNYIAAKTAK